MVDRAERYSRIVERVGELYRRLAGELARNVELAGSCKACGRCCDFDAYDHRLFVTPPELIYLAAGLGRSELKPMTTGRCPYNVAVECTVHDVGAHDRIHEGRSQANLQGSPSGLPWRDAGAVWGGDGGDLSGPSPLGGGSGRDLGEGDCLGKGRMGRGGRRGAQQVEVGTRILRGGWALPETV